MYRKKDGCEAGMAIEGRGKKEKRERKQQRKKDRRQDGNSWERVNITRKERGQERNENGLCAVKNKGRKER